MDPENVPAPAATERPSVVSCPSCESSYNVETHALVKDTGLPAKLRDAETERDVWKQKTEELNAKLATLTLSNQGQADELRLLKETAPKPRQDFFVA